MRQIYFRAWDSLHKHFDSTVAANLLMQLHEVSEDVDEEYGTRFFLDQYTGLIDNNGKQVYENDIVRVFLKGGDEVYFIRYNAPYARFQLANNRGDRYAFDYTTGMEVIGNMHEHAHLLNSEQGAPVCDATEDEQRTQS